jgi:hypothetical protein
MIKINRMSLSAGVRGSLREGGVIHFTSSQFSELRVTQRIVTFLCLSKVSLSREKFSKVRVTSGRFSKVSVAGERFSIVRVTSGRFAKVSLSNLSIASSLLKPSFLFLSDSS